MPSLPNIWERWVDVLLPAGLAALMALAVLVVALVSDPNGSTEGYPFPNEFGETFPGPRFPDRGVEP